MLIRHANSQNQQARNKTAAGEQQNEQEMQTGATGQLQAPDTHKNNWSVN